MEFIKIFANEGYVLTNGVAYSLDYICLGCNDSPDNWHQITIEEYNTILAEEEARNNVLY